jgi:hypothetical protein
MDGVEVGSPRLQHPQRALTEVKKRRNLAIDYKQSTLREATRSSSQE